jgi:hypothetical protein
MLDYIALGILIFVGITIFYGVIAIHDIPYEIAKHRNHPQQDAIHVAGWISLFTLHVLWPFLWIWATLYREDRGWGFSDGKSLKEHEVLLEDKVADLEARLALLEKGEAE